MPAQVYVDGHFKGVSPVEPKADGRGPLRDGDGAGLQMEPGARRVTPASALPGSESVRNPQSIAPSVTRKSG